MGKKKAPCQWPGGCTTTSQKKEVGVWYCKKHLSDWRVLPGPDGGGQASWVCGGCQKRVPAEYHLCHHCRSPAPAAPPPPSTATTTTAVVEGRERETLSSSSFSSRSLECGGGGAPPPLAAPTAAAAEVDLTTALLSCQNPDLAVRTAAEAALTSAEDTNLADFFLALAKELANEGRDATVRQLAGLHLKNLLVAKNKALQAEKHARWKLIPAEQRSVIKSMVIGAIRSPVPVARHTVSRNQWIVLDF